MRPISTFNSKARELFRFTPLQYMLDTFCENPNLGKLFVDDETNPNTCILSLKHLLFIGGDQSPDCLHFLSNEIFTDNIRSSGRVFFIFYPDEGWKNALTDRFAQNYNQYERSLYCINPSTTVQPPCWDHVVEITADLMNSTTHNLDMITEEIIGTGTYNDLKDYLSRGIGYAPVIDNKVCGFCTSEYPSINAIAIGIEVLEEYQRQGYAKGMTQLFLSKAALRGLTVYWECWKNNVASVNTGLSCGFEKVADYPILFLKF